MDLNALCIILLSVRLVASLPQITYKLIECLAFFFSDYLLILTSYVHKVPGDQVIRSKSVNKREIKGAKANLYFKK